MRRFHVAGRLLGVDDAPGASAPTDDDEVVWPLHQRLAGAVVRTAAVGAGLVPLALVLAEDEGPGLGAAFLGLALVAAFPILALERRDRGVIETLRWLFAGAAVGAVLAPVAFVTVQNTGDPMAAFAALERGLTRAVLPVFAAAVLAGLGAVVFGGALFVVRARTRRVGPQVVAGVAAAVAFASPFLREVNDREWAGTLAGLLAAALAPACLVATERWTARLDPRAPAPEERDPRPVLAWFALVMILPGIAMGAVGSWRARARRASSVGGEFARLLASGLPPTLVDDGPRSLVEVGPSLVEPGFDDVSTRWRGELLVARLVVSKTGERWVIVVDSLGPPGAHRSFAVDDRGLYRPAPTPLRVDPYTCVVTASEATR